MIKEIKIGEEPHSDTGAAQLQMEIWDIPAPFSAAFVLRWTAQ